MVVELIGPVVDDGDAVGRTISEAFTRGGLALLPGALEQVAGMAPAHALRTLAEGHGRFEMVEDLDHLLARTVPTLNAWAIAGTARMVPGAAAAWHALAAPNTSRAMLTTLPRQAAEALAQRLAIAVEPEEWICADDLRGPPHPDHVAQHVAGRGEHADAVALVQSVGAALAAASAGCRVVAVGARSGAAMFADQHVTTIGEYR